MMAAVHDDVAAEFAATAQDILTRLGASQRVAAELDSEGFSRTAWSAAAEAGWLEALVSEEAGGLGLTLRELGPIFTAAGRHLFSGPLAEHAIAGALAASVASAPARDRLRAALSGETLLTLVDAAATGTGTAPELGARRLSGSCELVRFAAQADELMVVAGTAAGPAVLLIRSDRPGVGVIDRASLDPATTMASVRFDEADVDDADVVAAGDDAADLIDRTRAGIRIAVACELSGIADHVLALAVDYAKERQQFGRPIGSFQALQHILAEMAREAFGLSRLCREAAAAAVPGTLEVVSLVAKAHAAATARSVTEGSMQVHGGIAFTIEHQLHRYYKHVLFLEGFYWDRHEIHETLGRRLLEATGDPWPAWH
jgi:alkylation response protein AidB-like acyl-CoA dehydrogenase